MLSIQNVTIKTRQPILANFNFEFQPHKVYGLIASNGSGKTTFFRSVMQLIPSVKGKYQIDGLPIGKQLQKIVYFESSNWFDDNLSGLDYLLFIKQIWGSSIDIKNLIQDWQMIDYIKLPIKKYSLGMKQRLLIGLYEVSDAKYMLMDEITNGLDEGNRDKLFSKIKQLRDNDKMIVISSHYKEDLESICDYELFLENNTMVVKNA
ncbi:ATP-binding cassette domain-containing protein [Pediococcus ethanolidurans]|uniref:ABC-2 type transport system ATP-binding protein n=2 Tax=Pediococcus ethanolidurans TaxID=319653 RepID=A0A1H9SC07_9LACO|nr:ABC transporter ATP-binding protein [Pediococcus ethanolidurans]GEN95726.1 ABC transporter ATP-binding protein [Pediococcus ethanolidurans]SER82542.1 ABC-2 type transport system ATP-binding protein [Pediococcus ethanolidurans]